MVGWTDAYVSGWGTTSEGGQVSDILRKVKRDEMKTFFFNFVIFNVQHSYSNIQE